MAATITPATAAPVRRSLLRRLRWWLLRRRSEAILARAGRITPASPGA